MLWRWLVCLFVFLNAADFAYADAAPKWTDAQLVDFATVVVRGRVTRIAAGRDPRVATVYTYVSLDVTEVLKGSLADRRLTLKQLGGQSGEIELDISGQPRFAIDEDVVVFLEVRPRDRTVATTASWQGKFTIVGGDSANAVARRQQPGAAPRGVFGDEARPLATWLNELRRQGAQTPIAPPPAIETAPAESARASVENAGPVTAAGWRPAGTDLADASIRVDRVAAASSAATDADAVERSIRDGAEFWTAAGVATLAAGGLQPPGCFLTREPQGRIAIGTDECDELDPRGGTVAISGRWVSHGTNATGVRVAQVVGAGVITNSGATAQRLLRRESCLEQLTTHELGHTLGISHSADGSGAMAAFVHCEGGFGTIVAPRTAVADASAVPAFVFAVPRLLLAPIGPAVAAAPIAAGIERVSVASDGTQANDASYTPSVSTDGRYIAFQSYASNLVAGDTNNQLDIFVRDRATSITTRENLGPAGVQANAGSDQPAVSADGRYVAFLSSATNLVTGVAGSHVYVRDRVQGVTIVGDVSTSGAPANDTSYRPAISGNGRYVGFDSSGTNLVSGDTNACLDVFLHDILAPGPTVRASVASGGAQVTCASGEVGSFGASLSGDGRYVAFSSDAVSLLPAGIGPLPVCNVSHCSNVYVRDLSTDTTTLESVGTNGAVLNGFSPSMSGDGRYLVFERNTPGVNDEIYLRDRLTGQTTGLTTSGNSPKISADGRYVSYISTSGVVLYDRFSGQYITMVTDGLQTAVGGVVAFSSIGAWVVNDTNQNYDIFVAPLSGTPLAPGNLAYTLNGSTLTLTWSAPSGGGAPTAYTIEAGSASGAADIANISTGSTATTFSATVGGNGIFYIRVRAANASGTSGASNEIIVFVGAAVAPPGAPTGLTASASGSTVTLSWTAPASGGAPASYVVEAGSRSGAADLANFRTGTAATTFTANSVGAGTYFVRVRASNASGTGAPSNEAILIVAAGCAAPAAPANAVASVSGSTVTIAWASAADATSYVLEAGSSAGRSDLLVSNLGSASTSLTAVNVGAGSYYVRIRALNACGQGGPSNELLIVVR
jgi:Tol biopolymer transport system component